MSAHRDRSAAPRVGAGSLAVLAPAAAAALATAVLLPFVPDDLYIYLRMVRNVLAGDGWGFNPGEAVNVASSPLWFFLLLGLSLLLGVVPAVAQAASGVASMLGVAGVACLAGRLADDRRAAWAAGIVLAADAWMGRWFWSGMETGLAIAVVSWSLALRAGSRPGSREDRASGLLAAIAPLVRPELVLFSVACLAATLAEGGVAARRRATRDAVALAVAGASWAAFALPTWGSILPSTAVAKGTLGAAHMSSLAALGRVGLVLLSTQAVALGLLVLLASSWARPGAPASEAVPGRREVTRTVFLFAAALAAAYALQHVRVYTRYVLPLSALVAAAGFAAVHVRARRSAPPAARALRVVPVVATVAVNLALSATLVVPKTLEYARSMRDVVLPLAMRLDATLPPEATIAIPDIGAVGFYTGRRILDLNGLATPGLVPFKREGRLGDYLAAHPPDVLVGIDEAPRRWLERLPESGLSVEGVYRFDGMFVRGPDPIYLTVYSLGELPPGAAGATGAGGVADEGSAPGGAAPVTGPEDDGPPGDSRAGDGPGA